MLDKFQSLLPHAYGSKVEGKSWSYELKSNMVLTTILARAKANGLLDLDITTLQNGRHFLAAAIQRCKSAREKSGLIVDAAMIKKMEDLATRSLCTEVEYDLCTLVACKPNDHNDIVFKVQSAIRKLRSASIRENEVLPACMYKWAYSVLVSK